MCPICQSEEELYWYDVARIILPSQKTIYVPFYGKVMVENYLNQFREKLVEDYEPEKDEDIVFFSEDSTILPPDFQFPDWWLGKAGLYCRTCGAYIEKQEAYAYA